MYFRDPWSRTIEIGTTELGTARQPPQRDSGECPSQELVGGGSLIQQVPPEMLLLWDNGLPSRGTLPLTHPQRGTQIISSPDSPVVLGTFSSQMEPCLSALYHPSYPLSHTHRYKRIPSPSSVQYASTSWHKPNKPAYFWSVPSFYLFEMEELSPAMHGKPLPRGQLYPVNLCLWYMYPTNWNHQIAT